MFSEYSRFTVFSYDGSINAAKVAPSNILSTWKFQGARHRTKYYAVTRTTATQCGPVRHTVLCRTEPRTQRLKTSVVSVCTFQKRPFDQYCHPLPWYLNACTQSSGGNATLLARPRLSYMEVIHTWKLNVSNHRSKIRQQRVTETLLRFPFCKLEKRIVVLYWTWSLHYLDLFTTSVNATKCLGVFGRVRHSLRLTSNRFDAQ